MGKAVYLNGSSKPSTIVGVVARMQVPATGSWANNFTWYSTLVPTRLNGYFSRYAIRAKPGRLEAVMHAVTPALYKVNPMRVLDDDSVRSFAAYPRARLSRGRRHGGADGCDLPDPDRALPVPASSV